MGKKNKDVLGRALIKDRYSKNRHRKHVEDQSLLHSAEVNDGYEWGRLNLQSVTAESSLQEFLSIAELADREFTSEKLNMVYVSYAPSEVPSVSSKPHFDEPLTVPRRPRWKPGIEVEEQLLREKDSFLAWRRHLNELQAKLGAALTPYERNLELWRQLWRTLEKSDVVLLLLDARHPLLFRCADLEKYAAEEKCKCILLLNKADLITEYERKCWCDYFNKLDIPVIFFSAVKSTNVQKEITENKNVTDDSDLEDSGSDSENENIVKFSEDSLEHSHETDDEDIATFKKQLNELDDAVSNTAQRLNNIQDDLEKLFETLRLGNPVKPGEQVTSNETPIEKPEPLKNSSEVFDRTSLLDVLRKQFMSSTLKNIPRLTVGMIGYPNVGKSSTVNVLMQSKKVSVSTMPGHTRHVQSLFLDEDIEILDCPGLVLPAYAVAPDLLLTAVLPIDQMRSHDAAVNRLCQLVSKSTFEKKYGLLLPKEATDPTYKQILTAHAYNRGFMTAAGQPDVSRSARTLLKDAANGRLHWAQLPPGNSPDPDQSEQKCPSEDRRQPTPRETRVVEGWVSRSAEIDKAFFAADKGIAHVKGNPIAGLSQTHKSNSSNLDRLSKPWKLEKRHANKNKREKLRRVYAHLDEH